MMEVAHKRVPAWELKATEMKVLIRRACEWVRDSERQLQETGVMEQGAGRHQRRLWPQGGRDQIPGLCPEGQKLFETDSVSG